LKRSSSRKSRYTNVAYLFAHAGITHHRNSDSHMLAF